MGSSNPEQAVMSDGSAASYQIQLVAPEEREQTTASFVQEVNQDLQDIAGAEITVSEASSGAAGFGDPIQIQISGPETEVLQQLSDQVLMVLEDVEGVYNPTSSLADTQPEMQIQVNRELAAQYGLSYQEIMSQIQIGFTGQTVMQYREDGEEMNVTLMFPEDERSTINDLENLKIQNQQGTMISLTTVADFEQVQSPATITRQDQQRQVNITSGISGSDLGTISANVEAALNGMNFPEEYDYSIGGQAEDMVEAFADLSLALLLSIFLVYAVMAVQFENFLFPLIIMFSMPATAIGVFGGLFVTGQPYRLPPSSG